MPRSASEIQEDIDAINAAITRALAAQSVSSDGTSVSNANLETLYKERRLLRDELEDANGDRTLFVRGQVTGLRRP